MEQVYIIKLKELPQPPPPPTRNVLLNEPTINGIKVNSPLEGKDLNRQSLFGFSVFQLILGFLSIIFSILGAYKDWTHAFGVFTGIVYIFTSMAGILVSEGPLKSSSLQSQSQASSKSLSWTTFSRSTTFLWIILTGQFVILIISTLFTWLTMFGIICAYNSTINLRISLITANGLQFIFSLFSSFTICRILNPEFLIEYLPSWPDNPKVSSKVIVQTSIYPRVLKSGDFSRLLGPNCLVSLVPPHNNHINQQRLNAINNTSPENPRMVDQATETDDQFEDINVHVLSSTPKYFSRSPSLSSISNTTIGSSHCVTTPEKDTLPVLGSSPTTDNCEIKCDTTREEEEEEEVNSDYEVSPINESNERTLVDASSSQDSEKTGDVSSHGESSDSHGPQEDEDPYPKEKNPIRCKILQNNPNHHNTVITTIH